MAISYKNIVITPNISNTADPKIVFQGANSTVNTSITLFVYPTSNGTISFEGSAGQLFSISNDLSNILYAVNDISGIPQLEVFANGVVSAVGYGGKVGIGTLSPTARFQTVTSTDGAPSTITAFDDRHATFGISTADAIAISKTTAGSAYISSARPGVAWDPLAIQSSTFSVNPGGSTTKFHVAANGNIGLATVSPNLVLTVNGHIGAVGAGSSLYQPNATWHYWANNTGGQVGVITLWADNIVYLDAPTSFNLRTGASVSAMTVSSSQVVNFVNPPTVNSIPIPLADYGAILFGNGTDGNVTVSGAVTLTHDMYYNNLTIAAGAALNTAGFRVFVAGTLDLTAAPADGIRLNGGAGTAASGTTGGAAGAAFSSTALIGPPEVSTPGTNGGTASSSLPGIVTNRTYARQDMAGGRGGQGGAGSGGTGAVPVSRTTSGWVLIPLYHPSTDQTAWISSLAKVMPMVSGISSSGGSGGGGDGTAGGGGGGGGTAGGEIFIAAKVVSRGGSTAAGAIAAKGGAGGAGGAPAGGNRGGGGGGGGGSGGHVTLIAGSLTGSTGTNAIDVSAGNGATAGNGTGTGAGGEGGAAGSGGVIYLYNLTAGTLTVTKGSGAIVTGGAASGTTGGTGATAATVRASI